MFIFVLKIKSLQSCNTVTLKYTTLLIFKFIVFSYCMTFGVVGFNIFRISYTMFLPS